MPDNHILDHTPAEQPEVKQNKTTLLVIGMCLVTGFAGETLNSFYSFNDTVNTIISIASSIGRIGALSILMRAGTLNKTRPYIQLIYFFAGIVILGALFKIQHWPFSAWMQVSGLTGIMLTYAMHFIKKENKIRLDSLKLAWVIVEYASLMFGLMHLPFADQLLIIESIVIIILYADFAYPHLQADNQVA